MPQHLGVDGYPRSKEQDEQISKVIESVFKTPNGMEMLQYLKSVTIEAISGANISDAELSLISAISGLDNKLEELDHNISLLSKENKNVTKNLPSDPDLQKRVKDLEEKIFKLDGKNKTDLGKKYLNTLPAKGRFSSTKKGYFTGRLTVKVAFLRPLTMRANVP